MKRWHPLCNQYEHIQYIKRLNKGFKRCVLCGRATPDLFCAYTEKTGTEKKYCSPCSWLPRELETGFITEEVYRQRIRENKEAGELFEKQSYY